MFAISLEVFFVIFLSLGLMVFLALSIYYDRRDTCMRTQIDSRTVYHCIRCGRIYSAHKDDGACPECGFENKRLQF